MLNERKLTKSELAKREDIIMKMKDNKRALVQKYGKDAEAVMYGRATNLAKKQAESMDQDKIKELVKDALQKPVKEGNAFIVAADAARDAGKKEFEFPKGSGKMHPVTVKADIDEMDLNNEKNIGLAYIEEMGYEAGEAAFEEIKGRFRNKPDHKAYRKGFFQGYIDNAGSYNLNEGTINEDLDLGHQDNEPHMLKGDLYRIGKYAMELYQMVDGFEGQGEVDFPHWWQSKIIRAKEMVSSAKHYLDFEVKEPQIDAMVGAIDQADALDNVGVDQPVFEDEVGETDKLAAAIQKALNKNKSAEDQNNIKQARKAMNDGNIEAAKKILQPYLAEKIAERLAKLEEGTWAVGSSKDIKSVMDALDQMMDLKRPQDVIRYLSKLDKFLYNTVGDDSFHDSIDNAKREAKEGNMDRVQNNLADAYGRAQFFLEREMDKEGIKEETGKAKKLAERLAKQLKSK